ncbi:hypothetical protein WJ96_07670 [Burkholderia ubonensis]|uniref:Uncharacterized protein n=1 Tax=Burkholderia ubonensis TaxID=101571 RepID=A0AAW3MXW7_9BURK|nr:hypothetical protein [Burkholderia ubonensis]KVP75578.1 hypothetical protein WJ93_09470 [Burkholderia ubonensis]KVP97040.1 hypothetical protein WJ97_14575 [Burkholderia ubonensis]KVP98390.1 hypothetical protein WJ96_07670 [Burkholderia ubonensis]KVZ93089.1 hypothetical protein WL25_19335 [Burkholderia ubonensis]
MNIALNNEQQLFVISSGNSVSCLGFQVVFEQAREFARRLQAVSEKTLLAKGMASLRELVAPSTDEIGTLKQYTQYRALLAGYSKLEDNATWFDARTPRTVQRVLEEARKSGDRMRVFQGDTKTGRDWMEEYDTIGRIGRSTGTMKSPLLVPEGDFGGPALLTHCILRVINLTTGKEVYRHRKYFTPKMELSEAASYARAEGYTNCVKVESKDGVMETHANFKSQESAIHWMAFMNGVSHDYPRGE